MVFGSHSAQAALTRLGRVDDSNLCVPVRVQYAIALGQGVSFFFVLSGFILTFVYPTLDTGREVRGFWLARFARIWPAYMATFPPIAAFFRPLEKAAAKLVGST